MSQVPKDMAKEMRRIATLVKQALPSSMGFILFLELKGNLTYIANAERSSAIETLEEWLEKTETQTMWVGPPAPVQQAHERSKQEDRCATIGKVIGLAARVCLFVIDFGDGGNLSYWSNIEMNELRRGIETWVKKAKS